MSDEAERVRVDVWLWGVRMFRTRSAATEACKRGGVRINGVVAKPARDVVAGDRITFRVAGRARELDVVGVTKKRVGAPIAAELYNDLSPEPQRVERLVGRDGPTAERERGTGRPTKRDRRQLDQLRGRD